MSDQGWTSDRGTNIRDSKGHGFDGFQTQQRLHVETMMIDLGELSEQLLVGGQHEVPEGAARRGPGEKPQAGRDARVAPQRGDRRPGGGGRGGPAGRMLEDLSDVFKSNLHL